MPDFSAFYFTPTFARVPDLRWSALGDIVFHLTNALAGSVGLQTLSFICLLAGIVFLRRLWAGPLNGWAVALLAAVAMGTYQLQLPRNAVFSLPLTALVFWLFARFRETRRGSYAWLLPVVVGIWSLLHASCLLGMALVVVLMGVDALEGRRDLWRRLRLTLLVTGATLAVVTIGNPAAVRMLRRPISVLTQAVAQSEEATPREARVSRKVATPRAVPPSNVKDWLNQLIWPTTPGQVRSADFSSPLDRLSYRPVAVAFGLMFLAVVWALWAQRPALPFVAAFLATAILGLSYFRMTGYAAIGSAALILTSGPLRGRVAEALGKSSWIGAALTLLFAATVWGASFSGSLPGLIGNSRHVLGFGKVATFDDRATDWLFTKYPSRRVFTTIVTGSYALHRWEFKKPVFIDGFFAPHTSAVWRDYVRARQEPERDLLREKYAIDFALVEHTREDWNNVFLSRPDWQPVAIGAGCTVYGHRSVVGEGSPGLLVSAREAAELPPSFRSALARNYYGALLSLFAAERFEAAEALVAASPEAYKRWRRWLPPPERAAVRAMDRFRSEDRLLEE